MLFSSPNPVIMTSGKKQSLLCWSAYLQEVLSSAEDLLNHAPREAGREQAEQHSLAPVLRVIPDVLQPDLSS